ncbi:MAG: methyltransferase domain-containing protein [Candidatus Aminicenantes bacterium]|nr:methyltransferase domain-containing protein [Candidatus Aminicenantes bacterium]
MKNISMVLCLILLFLFSGLPAGQWGPYDVPYVSTPYEVVEEMLRMADVNSKDVLYDLGCGDGRIVITAAKKYGCRGMGVDIDAQRIKESRENAVREKVENQVRFIQKDLFEVDVSEASVVTLYLLSSVNLKLRPKLLGQLKPGSRIVSHDFSMGEWEADAQKDVYVSNDKHKIFFWVVPAEVSGIWRWAVPMEDKQLHYEMQITQKFNKVWALLNLGSMKKSIEDFDLDGGRVRFTLEQSFQGNEVVMSYEGQAEGDNINGLVMWMDRDQKVTKKWKARRDPERLGINPIS